jgi:hypothetical protein
LYWILACTTADCDQFRQELIQAAVPKIIGADISNLQPTYQTDEVTRFIKFKALNASIICYCVQLCIFQLYLA